MFALSDTKLRKGRVIKMIRLIVGEKGTGKTKTLLENVHNAAERDHGSVVFINNGKRHIHDLSYKVRMVDTSDFAVTNYDEMYGVLCGIISQDYDITNIFIDSLTKIASGTEQELEAFLEKASRLCAKFNIEMMITISAHQDSVGDPLKKYIA